MDEGFEKMQIKSGASIYPKESLLAVENHSNSLTVSIPKEFIDEENRVSLKPEAVEVLTNYGLSIIVESHAGIHANFEDVDYSNAGAKIVYSHKEALSADIILKIEPPTLDEIEEFQQGATLISAFQTGRQSPEFIHALNKKKITAIGYEFMEDQEGSLMIVRALSEIAGSTVMLIAAEQLSSANGGKGIMLGGITGVPPTRVVILGAGTVAQYAARASLGLGIDIQIFDNNVYKLRRIRETLGHHVFTSTIDHVTLLDSLKRADVLIGAIRADKGKNKVVVTEEMVKQMKKGAVVIDVTVDQGGCIETSESRSMRNACYNKWGVRHYCVPNLAARVPMTASIALSNIFTPILQQVCDNGGIEDMIYSHKWFLKGVYTYKGNLTNIYLARKFGIKYTDLSLFMTARY